MDKTDPRIRLRGRLDSLHARAVLACAYATRYGYTNIIMGTGDIVRVTAELVHAEATGKKPEIRTILGMTMDELREASNHPRSELGLDHYYPDANCDLMTAHLDMLRTQTRETELDFCAAPDDPVCQEIQFVLNRLSAAAYILMLECRSERL